MSLIDPLSRYFKYPNNNKSIQKLSLIFGIIITACDAESIYQISVLFSANQITNLSVGKLTPTKILRLEVIHTRVAKKNPFQVSKNTE